MALPCSPAKLGQTICKSLPKKSAAWQSFALGKATPPGFVAFGVGFDVAIKTSASDSEAYCYAMAVSSEVVEDIAKCYACFILSSVPLKLTVGQNDFRPKP